MKDNLYLITIKKIIAIKLGNTVTSNAEQLLEVLCESYLKISNERKSRRFPFSKRIGNEDGTVYFRWMMLRNIVCLAEISFDEDVQQQGVLRRFIRFITENPCQYNGIEIELIHNPYLAESLEKQGWKRSGASQIEYDKAPTFTKMFSKKA